MSRCSQQHGRHPKPATTGLSWQETCSHTQDLGRHCKTEVANALVFAASNMHCDRSAASSDHCCYARCLTVAWVSPDEVLRPVHTWVLGHCEESGGLLPAPPHPRTGLLSSCTRWTCCARPAHMWGQPQSKSKKNIRCSETSPGLGAVSGFAGITDMAHETPACHKQVEQIVMLSCTA